MDNVLAMQGVVRHRTAYRLSDAQAIRVVEEGGGSAGLGHLLELAALFPGVCPGAVVGRIANGVVGNSSSVVGGHLVLPVGIAIGVGDRLENCAQRASGVGIPLLGKDIAATVIVVYPGGAGAAGGSVAGIVHPGELAQIVVNIRSGHAVTGGGENVARV